MAAVTTELQKIPTRQRAECCPEGDRLTLNELGVTYEITLKSVKANPNELGPEEYGNMMKTNNKLTLWMVLTEEQLADLSKGVDNIMVESFPGGTLMPFFDKVILTTTPVQALMHFLYHFSEQHVLPSNTKKVNLLSFEPDVETFSYLMANKAIDLFLRASKTLQVQVRQGTRWILNELELETQQQWCMWHKTGYEHIFDQLSWSNGFTWTYNTCIDLRVDSEKAHCGIMQALHYGGVQQLHFMPTEIQQKLLNMLKAADHGQEVIGFHGMKTIERIRGSPLLSAWMVEGDYSLRVAENIKCMNEWRQSCFEGTDAMNIEDWNVVGDGMET